MRIGCADFFDLVVNFTHCGGELVHRSLAFDVHEINFRVIEEEMIVQCRNAQAVVERGGHHRIRFVFKENGVAHHHCAAFRFGERSPCAEPQERRHRPAVDRNFHVAARPRDFINVFFFAELALEAGDLIDLRPIKRGR